MATIGAMLNGGNPFMTLHESTFQYIKPTERQLVTMQDVREAFERFATMLQLALPDGPDKTHVIRLVRDAAMWSHVAITRNQDGSPRDETYKPVAEDTARSGAGSTQTF